LEKISPIHFDKPKKKKKNSIPNVEHKNDILIQENTFLQELKKKKKKSLRPDGLKK
jgi:hypothetical protein